MTRRAALAGAAGAAVAPFVARPAAAGADHGPVPPGLNAHANRGNRFFGTAIDNAMLHKDAEYMAQVAIECGMLTGEASFKWGRLRPAADRFDFTQPDALLDYARRQAIQVRGHTLLWHQDNPPWLEAALTPDTAEKILVTHIAAVAGHCRGRVVHWDVANEVVSLPYGNEAGLRDTLWSRALGERALDIAFHACAEADPGALRFLNEYGLEYAWATDQAKREAVLALLSRLKARGVPIQGLGIQAHLEAGVAELDQTVLRRFVGDVASLGLKVAITELDCRDNRLTGDQAQRDAAVADHTAAYLDAVLDSPATLGVLSWGLSDRRSWLNDEHPRTDKQAQRALPLDDTLKRKPMWYGIAGAFDRAQPRA